MAGRRSFGSACALLVFALTATSRAAAIDVSGVYVGEIIVFSENPCTLTFAQSGSALTIDGPCTFDFTDYTFDLEGSINPTTGEFTATGVLFNLCETPGSVTMTGTGDGEVFTAVATCGTFGSPVSGTKCGNGTIDSTEDCEDGNTLAGDCCSPVCLFEPSGSACAADVNSCTLDQCDGAGLCEHLPAGSGSPCASDANACTDDVCNLAGQCTHPPNAGSCDDMNACTTADACSASSCVGGPIAPECVGDIDLSGGWEVTASSPGFIGPNNTIFFSQDGAVLQSSVGAGTGVGSIDPATGEFVSRAPFTVLFALCTQYIQGVASPDGQTFTGTAIVGCGLDGTYGPTDVTGRRCPAPTCICVIDEPCTPFDVASQAVVSQRDAGAAVRWRWRHSPITASFGDPTVDTDYEICFETPGGTFVEAAAQGEGWRSSGSGFVYESRTGPIRRLTLRENAKRTALVATILTESTPVLPLTAPLRMRLLQHRGSDTICFEAQFENPSVNTARRFRASE